MTFFGPSSRYEQIDSPDVLEFRVISVLQGVHLLTGGVSAAIFVAFLAPVWIGILAGPAVAGSWYLLKWNDATPRVLKVTSTALEASGKGPSERLLWGEVMRLEHRNGGEDEPSGLAAKTGRWKWVWLVKDVDSEQAERSSTLSSVASLW